MLPHRSRRSALGYRLLRPAPARGLSDRQADTWSPISAEWTHTRLPRDLPLPQMTNVSSVSLPVFLSFTQLNRCTFYLHGIAQAATRASRTSTCPTRAAVLGSLRQAVHAHSRLNNTGDGDDRRGDWPALAYQTDKSNVIPKRVHVSGLTLRFSLKIVRHALAPSALLFL
jgi:hypothetical protein